MVWSGLPGSGDMLMNSGDTLITGTISAQKLTADTVKTGNMSLQSVNVTSWAMVSSAGNFLMGIERTNVGSARGAIGMADIDVAGLAPNSGNISAGGWLFVQSGGLHFMGALGNVTVVGSP